MNRFDPIDSTVPFCTLALWRPPLATTFDEDLTVRLVDLIAELEAEGGSRGPNLAERLQVSISKVRKELKELEQLGVVRRTGFKRGTRWWLG